MTLKIDSYGWKLLGLYLNTIISQKFVHFLSFKEEVKTMVFLVFPNFDLIFGQNMDS